MTRHHLNISKELYDKLEEIRRKKGLRHFTQTIWFLIEVLKAWEKERTG